MHQVPRKNIHVSTLCLEVISPVQPLKKYRIPKEKHVINVVVCKYVDEVELGGCVDKIILIPTNLNQQKPYL